ncbi:flavin-binding monooxygenase-like protein-like protein [Cucurbitaria berberidis CBS 394.84]|uniref:L-ornithine N(5)-monooxygenase [NAD(P)H] n=1 Tax=Cucurbitaria berberidis CBS 394.84 TaxID=1168544 RepID=A0A9P4L9B0_9PLEO|nr:flavin-binding monooxygenase-like protein-like protein [Cucurbitaria berberidis CBS 394.84]KAF1846034.1 flavin-binding monooxygenase-like protein-like protein [Cucurbitaria berberidis CBS 394.84]
MAPQQEHHDVVVIGAGFAGLITAHRYLDLHPTASLVIVDRNVHVGGVWSRDRIYPGFYTQFVTGLAEFSDLKMRNPPKEDCIGDCFKANWMSDYLQEFATKMIHDGKSLQDRFRRAEIVNVTRDKLDKYIQWRVVCRDLTGHEDNRTFKMDDGEAHIDVKTRKLDTKLFTAQKLIVATGEFSTPKIPSFRNHSQFGAPVIHSTNFGESAILSKPDIKHVAILGAGKSSADMLYLCIKSLPPSTTFHWIIRADGTGPGWFSPIDLASPYASTIESANTQAMSFMQPSIFHEEGWWVWFLHRTWLGVWLVSWLFGLIDAEAKKRAGYFTRGKESQERGFEQLDYSPGIFWMNSAGGALHHKDFWDLIASRVVVHRAHITSTSDHTLHLSNDTQISCDALLLGTGWTSSLTFLSDELKAELGLPHDHALDSPETAANWNTLEIEAEKEVFKRFPILANPPKHKLKRAYTTPYRLYRGIAPLNDPSHSIVFVNFLLSGNMIMNAESQAPWAVAYLSQSNQLRLPSIEEQKREVAMQVAWSRRRYLSTGQLGNFAGFDAVMYTGLLLRDIGVEGPWKAKGAWGVRRPGDLGEAWKLFMENQKRLSAKEG